MKLLVINVCSDGPSMFQKLVMEDCFYILLNTKEKNSMDRVLVSVLVLASHFAITNIFLFHVDMQNPLFMTCNDTMQKECDEKKRKFGITG